MKIKALAQIVKKQKVIEIYNDKESGLQWIGDGTAAYPLSKLIKVDTESVMVLLDIPRKEWGKYTVTRIEDMGGVDISDNANISKESELPPPYINGIIYGGQILTPAAAPNKLMLFDPAYLKPLADENITLYARKQAGGAEYIAAKSGPVLKGIITPVETNSADIADRLEVLARELRQSIGANLRLDEKTGEVIE